MSPVRHQPCCIFTETLVDSYRRLRSRLLVTWCRESTNHRDNQWNEWRGETETENQWLKPRHLKNLLTFVWCCESVTCSGNCSTVDDTTSHGLFGFFSLLSLQRALVVTLCKNPPSLKYHQVFKGLPGFGGKYLHRKNVLICSVTQREREGRGWTPRIQIWEEETEGSTHTHTEREGERRTQEREWDCQRI